MLKFHLNYEEDDRLTGPDADDADDIYAEDEEIDEADDYDEKDDGSPIITMVDTETNEEYQFVIADDFDFEGEVYCVLVTLDEDDPEAVIVRVVGLADGSEGFESLEDEEFDRVAAEYERLCAEADEEDEHDHDHHHHHHGEDNED